MAPPVMTPGDILLHYNTGIISDLIRLFDGSEYSHSSLVRNPEMVAEANAKGIGLNPLQPAIAAGRYTDTYRLNSSPASLDPALARADHYLNIGGRYAFEQLLFLAVLCTTRQIPLPAIARMFLRKLLDAAVSILNRIIASGREPMICSEFVFRCFDEADPAPSDVYTIVVGSFASSVLLTQRSIGLVGGQGPRGIHKDSLLAVVAKRRQVLGFAPQVEIALPPDRKESSERLEQNLAPDGESYIAAVAKGHDAGWLTPDDLAMDAEIVARLDRLVAAARPMTGPGAAIEMAPAVRLAMDYSAFSRTVADFVTPNDLSSSRSLHNAGRTMGTS
jgi:hypothetical protein